MNSSIPINDSVSEWIQKLRSGDEYAAQALWSRFFNRMTAIARRKMRGRTTAVADYEDIALSAFKSFCVRIREGGFPELDRRDNLWQLLFLITARKAVDQIEWNHRQKRNVDKTEDTGQIADQDLLAGLVAAEPTPEIQAEFNDTMAHLFRLLKSDELIDLALRRMEGYSNHEISRALSVSLTTVERKLRIIRSIWSREL